MGEAHTGSEVADIISPHLEFSRVSGMAKNKKTQLSQVRGSE